jgi:expansin (peptidoglycan-binding protein)
MNATDYDGSAACGGLIVVTNDDTGLSVTVRIDDQCPECAKGDVDLDQNAFAQIAEIEKGRIPISWHYIANDQAGNMKLYFKEGSTTMVDCCSGQRSPLSYSESGLPCQWNRQRLHRPSQRTL